MQRLEVSGAVRPIYGSLGVKRLMNEMIQSLRSTFRTFMGAISLLWVPLCFNFPLFTMLFVKLKSWSWL